MKEGGQGWEVEGFEVPWLPYFDEPSIYTLPLQVDASEKIHMLVIGLN